MNNIKEILKEYNFKINSLKYIGKVIILDTDMGKYVYKNKNNQVIYDYLESRGFNYFPKTINKKNTNYEIVEYISDKDNLKEQKIYDLRDIVSFLHKKTAFNKEIDLDEIKKMYENINNEADYLMSYYQDLNNIIDNTLFMSPLEYLLIRNIDLFYYLISFVKVESLNWYNNIKNKKIIKYSMIHNNLDISHILESDSYYLISWDKAHIDFPYKDIKKMIENSYYEIDIEEFINGYLKNNKLDYNEYLFLLINLALPKKIILTNDTYLDTYKLSNYLEYVRKIVLLVQKKEAKYNKI